MEFDLPASSIAVRAELQEILSSATGGAGADHVWSLSYEDRKVFSLELCRKLGALGLLTPHWPVEYGGRGGSVFDWVVVNEEMLRNAEPRGPQYMNVNWIGPALLGFGTQDQQARFLPPMAAGDVRWCQGFSETEAGSDLKSLRTRATAGPSGYTLDGSKIWTSYADQADWAIVLAKESTPDSADDAMSLFMVDMTSPGVTVTQLPTIIPGHPVHQMHFDSVQVGEDCRLGPAGQAWEVVRHCLAKERVGVPEYAKAQTVLDDLARELTGRATLTDEAAIGIRRARAACEGSRLLTYRAVANEDLGLARSSGDAYIARAAMVDAMRMVADLVARYATSAALDEGGVYDRQLKDTLVASIAGGAYEVLLGLIARVVLRLPRSA
jgi:alkylation response protein AidB-like acyl-CoA dehydrogenase